VLTASCFPCQSFCLPCLLSLLLPFLSSASLPVFLLTVLVSF
jgi:hypothetical protein